MDLYTQFNNIIEFYPQDVMENFNRKWSEYLYFMEENYVLTNMA